MFLHGLRAIDHEDDPLRRRSFALRDDLPNDPAAIVARIDGPRMAHRTVTAYAHDVLRMAQLGFGQVATDGSQAGLRAIRLQSPADAFERLFRFDPECVFELLGNREVSLQKAGPWKHSLISLREDQ